MDGLPLATLCSNPFRAEVSSVKKSKVGPMLHEGGENIVRVILPTYFEMWEHLDPGWPLLEATGIQVSHVASHHSLNENGQSKWPWVLSWSFHHPISIYFTCLPPRLWLTLPPHPRSALPGRTPSSGTLRGLTGSSASDPLSPSHIASLTLTTHNFSLVSPLSVPN